MNDVRTQYSADQILRLIRTRKDDFWLRERERRPLRLFHEAARRVPAYKDFLKKNKVHPEKIKTFKDFQLVPQISKKSYLREYPLEKLCWDGTLKKPIVFTATSGSTGEPFYFPRGEALDREYSVLAELFLKNNPPRSGGPTLVIVGFGMGVWIGGLITYKAFEIASQRGNNPVSIITPGINKKEIFHALRDLSPRFAQTILIGYPPFIKDVIDEAESTEKINLKKLHLRILTAAEAYTEKFRDYLVKKGGIKNLYLDTLNIYGTADIGAMAWETPISILIRRLLLNNKKLFNEIFTPIEKTPTLAQYNPLYVTFESAQGDILLSGDNTIPLIRYAIGDHGGVLSFIDAVNRCKDFGIDAQKEAQKVHVPLYRLPFVYVYERNDFSTTLYGLQIYPETIREALLEPSTHRFVTGKFMMATKYNKQQDQYLEINLEVRKKKQISTKIKERILFEIFSYLRTKNSEFRELSDFLGKRALPKLVFWPAEHPRYFRVGIKQKWVEKET